MKISIATLYGANNVGAFLQAFSLQTMIESINGENTCSFIRFSRPVEHKRNRLGKVVRYLKKGELGNLIFKARTARKYREVKQHLHIDNQLFEADRVYDCVIVGSDEVWNYTSSTFLHHEQYFAKNIQANNIIAYAPSAGNADISRAKNCGVDFSGFHHLSVRDVHTYNMVESMEKRAPLIVCDPTLLLESFVPFIKPLTKKAENYILVYSYGLTKDRIKEIKEFARKNKRKLISVGTYNAWCHRNIVADPFEFLAWLRDADMVITSTFHGAVLSVKLHKQVAVYAGENKKVKDFLTQMGIENRDASSADTLQRIFEREIDYQEIEKKINNLRNISMTYLKEAIASHENRSV